jgi:hypothetical protein
MMNPPFTVPSSIFATERLPLAIFLHATERLRFLRCEPSNRSGKVVFVFADADSRGSQAELEFDRGATVPATALFASQKYLRRKMTEALNLEKRRTENDDYRPRSICT